ncbi:MAG: type II toxin-antitoxin system VapC family toxin [Candidatus Diapherotrites archaeon]
MEQKICLDTSSIIDFLKGRNQSAISLLLEKNQKNLFVSAITAFELQQRRDNREPVERFLQKIPVVAFDQETARIAAWIFNELKRKGNPVEMRNIFIGATAMQWNSILVTQNRSDFEKMHEVKLHH